MHVIDCHIKFRWVVLWLYMGAVFQPTKNIFVLQRFVMYLSTMNINIKFIKLYFMLEYNVEMTASKYYLN